MRLPQQDASAYNHEHRQSATGRGDQLKRACTPGTTLRARACGASAGPPRPYPATNVQEQVQTLNAALPALGLSKVEIQEIDSIATQIQNFNPAAYTNLVNQFEALAHQPTQQNAANAASKHPRTRTRPQAQKRTAAVPKASPDISPRLSKIAA